MTLGIVIVNYRSAADTLECLESVFRDIDDTVRVVVVDNASGDGSADAVAAWAEGMHAAPAPLPALAHLSTPPVAKPVPHVRLSEAEAARSPPAAAALIILEAAANRGFAAGNNAGLRHLLNDPAIDAIWLLNPDTVIAPGTVASVRAALATGVGMCGTQVRYYFRPDRVQALNGHRFNPWTGTSRGIATEQSADRSFDAATVVAATDFVLGASLAVSREFLETVGLMEEGYFLYYEEIDWAWRGRGRFPLGFAADAVVYHKEGGSIGSSSQTGGRSGLSEYYLMRSKLKLIARHRPWLLPVHWVVGAAQIGVRLLRRQPDKARVMTRALLGLKG